jgi:hypothetical protein
MSAALPVLETLDAIPVEQIPAAIARLSARLMVPAAQAAADDFLSVDEAAKLLRCTPRWLYKHADELGVTRLSRRQIVFPRRTLLARVARKGRRS